MFEVRPHVYLLAGNRLFREALTRILNKKGQVRVVGANALGPDSGPHIAELKPELLLSDAMAISKPNAQLLPALRKVLPKLKIIMIGMDPDPELFLYAVRVGFSGTY